jgi:ferritin
VRDTPEEKARRSKLLDELRKLDEELELGGIDLTPKEAVSMVKQIRKEMTEERKMSEGIAKID